MATLGELVDALAIVTVKLYHVQDLIHEAARQDPDEYSQRSPQDTQEIFKKVTVLNLERNQLKTAIDECLAEAVSTGQVAVAQNVKLV